MMEILHNVSNRFKKDNIILKNRNEEKLAGSKQKTIIEEKDELKLSLKKEDSDGLGSINEIWNMNKNNNIEISMVEPEKLEEKQENIKQINELIHSCESDIKYLNDEIKNYENNSNDILMKSQILDNNISIIVINKSTEKKENEICDNPEQKMEIYNDLKNKFMSLKKKLEELLALNKTEKEFTEIKKNELEKLEKIKNEYKNLKYKKKK